MRNALAPKRRIPLYIMALSCLIVATALPACTTTPAEREAMDGYGSPESSSSPWERDTWDRNNGGE